VIVRPMIGNWEVPRVERIETLEGRRLARLPVPGLLGDLQQDLGADSLVVRISGSLHGDEARDKFLDELRQQFRAGEPVAFVADIVAATELDQVLIEELDLEEANDSADGFRYSIVLREYVEPPPEAAPFAALGAELGAELDGIADLGLDALKLPDVLIDLPALGNPVEPMKPALDQLQQVTEQVPKLLDGLRAALGVPDEGAPS